jgi:histidyl-tRNA synthetase
MTEQRKFQAIKGVRDILPPESALWNRVEQTAREVFATYGYGEIRLPIFEQTELFARSVGVDTDIVSKEMFTFRDPFEAEEIPRIARQIYDEVLKQENEEGFAALRRRVVLPRLEELINRLGAGELLSLRPEATASVCRAYIEHGMHTWPVPPSGMKLYYIGPMFRRERPQKGRYRQFYQIGAEVLGQSDAPAIDAEVIEMLLAFFDRCGLAGYETHVNSIGCKECRPKYVAKLKEALIEHINELKADSQRRVETNPLRVLDSKLPEEQAVIEKLPRITEHLCEACREHYAEVKKQLALRGVAYQENWRLVRGLDYYMRTTFEITAPGLGAQNAVCGGGRYDGLVELLGGSPTKGIGFAIGTDRLILSLQERAQQSAPLQSKPTTLGLDVFIAWMGAAAQPAAVKIGRTLRDAGFSVEVPAEEIKFKKSIGLADKLGARFALIIGENELREGKYALKRLTDGHQESFIEADLLEHLKSSM